MPSNIKQESVSSRKNCLNIFLNIASHKNKFFNFLKRQSKFNIKNTGPNYDWLIAILFGFLSFWIAVGLDILNPNLIGWLEIDDDPFVHQIGWMFFKNSPWSFPVGLNPSFGLDISNSIVFSDSIPLLAFLFKPFSTLFPGNFQYLGIWTLVCFILQGFFALKLLGLITNSRILILFALPFFVFSPIMLNRIGMHAALVGHFVILAGIYLSIKATQKYSFVSWAVLLVVSSLIHFYLLVIVFCLWLTTVFKRFQLNKLVIGRLIREIVFIVFTLLLVMWQAGYFAVASSSAIGGGYGLWGMNLLSFFNAKGWSYLLPEIPGVSSHQDRFQYPGIGVFFLIIFALIKIKTFWSIFVRCVNDQPWLLLLAIIFTIFSISNYVGIGAARFYVELPKALIIVGNFFRASDRFFWPVVYMIILGSMATVIKAYKQPSAILIFIVAGALQILDTRAGWDGLHFRLSRDSQIQSASPLKNPFWQLAAQSYSKIILVPAELSPKHWRIFSLFAAQHKMGTNATYLARVDSNKLLNLQMKLQNGVVDSSALYIIEPMSLPYMLKNLNFDVDLLTKVDGYIVLAPGWGATHKKSLNLELLEIENFSPPAPLREKILFNKFFEENKRYLLNGWSENLESWGVWSNGEYSQIFISLPRGSRPSVATMKLRAFINSRVTAQNIELSINGLSPQAFSLSSFEDNVISVSIPELAIKQGYISVGLKYSNAASPKELNIGDDIRVLAIGIQSIKIE